MFEKVNPSHPDKMADRIAGAIVDLAYGKEPNPKIAVEILIGHGICHAVIETSADVRENELYAVIDKPADRCILQTGGERIFLCPCDHSLGRIHMSDLCASRSRSQCGSSGVGKKV